MDKKVRKEQIKKEIKNGQESIAFHRRIINDLKLELDYMKGNYNRTWEEEYRGASK